MKRNSCARGFTIIEVMIFLAVSGVLFVIAATFLNGTQGRSEFSQAVRDLDSKMQDVINDVSTGFYPQVTTFRCTAAPGTNAPPDIRSGSNEQGSNEGCTFIGKVVHLNENNFNVITVAGRRLDSNGLEVQTLKESVPVPVKQGGIDATEYSQLQYQLKVTRIVVGGSEAGAVGVFTTFGQRDSDNNVLSGTQNARLGVLGSGLSGISLTETNIRNIASDPADQALNRAKNGVTICLKGATEQNGALKIGAGGRNLSTEAVINNKLPECP